MSGRAILKLILWIVVCLGIQLAALFIIFPPSAGVLETMRGMIAMGVGIVTVGMLMVIADRL
jgi:hypothetical protein